MPAITVICRVPLVQRGLYYLSHDFKASVDGDIGGTSASPSRFARVTICPSVIPASLLFQFSSNGSSEGSSMPASQAWVRLRLHCTTICALAYQQDICIVCGISCIPG